MTYQQHLKMDGWKTIVSFFRWPIFRAMFVSGRLDGIGGRVPTHSQVQVPYLPLTMDPFPSKKNSSCCRKGAIFALCSDAWACFFQAVGCPQNEAGGHNWGRIFFSVITWWDLVSVRTSYTRWWQLKYFDKIFTLEKLGKSSNLTNIFVQMGGFNHQPPVFHCCDRVHDSLD